MMRETMMVSVQGIPTESEIISVFDTPPHLFPNVEVRETETALEEVITCELIVSHSPPLYEGITCICDCETFATWEQL